MKITLEKLDCGMWAAKSDFCPEFVPADIDADKALRSMQIMCLEKVLGYLRAGKGLVPTSLFQVEIL